MKKILFILSLFLAIQSQAQTLTGPIRLDYTQYGANWHFEWDTVKFNHIIFGDGKGYIDSVGGGGTVGRWSIGLNSGALPARFVVKGFGSLSTDTVALLLNGAGTTNFFNSDAGYSYFRGRTSFGIVNHAVATVYIKGEAAGATYPLFIEDGNAGVELMSIQSNGVGASLWFGSTNATSNLIEIGGKSSGTASTGISINHGFGFGSTQIWTIAEIDATNLVIRHFTNGGGIEIEPTAGDVIVPNLGGGGTQMVTADNNGLLGVAAIPSGGGTPALTATQIAFGDVSNLMTSSSLLTWDNALEKLSVDGAEGIDIGNSRWKAGEAYFTDSDGEKIAWFHSSDDKPLIELGAVEGQNNGNIFKLSDELSISYFDNTGHNMFFGINTATPVVEFDLVGNVRVSGLGGAGDKIVKTDNDGDLSAITTSTVGLNFVGLADPSAITFIRVNADNSVTARSSADFKTDLGLVIGTNVQAFDADLSTWAGITPGANVGTFLTTPSSANLRAALTDENGTGVALFNAATSPDFTTSITIGGVTVPTISSTNTITNKRITARVTTIASSSTPTPDGDASDMFTVTALAAGATFSAPTGTPTDGQKLLIRILDNGTARSLAWNAIYRAGTDVALPNTTTLSKTMYVLFVYNGASTTWDLMSTTNGY